MNIPDQRDLFSTAGGGPEVGTSDYSFPASLLALHAINGLGHKALRSLVRALGDNLGAAFNQSKEKIEEFLAQQRLGTKNLLFV
jgi:hypothetical protein